MAPSTRRWIDKFREAGRGLVFALRTQASFRVHLATAVAVVLFSALLRVSLAEAGLLLLCIAMVLAAETMNTSIEHLARAITRDHHDEIGRALEVAAGAVLVASLGAAVVGSLVFLNRLRLVAGW